MKRKLQKNAMFKQKKKMYLKKNKPIVKRKQNSLTQTHVKKSEW